MPVSRHSCEEPDLLLKFVKVAIIEIITSDSPKGPSRDWLKFVKSSSAKTKIQQWFKKADREENIEKGKEILDREIKRIGMLHSDLFKQEWLNVVLQRFNYATLDDMFAAIRIWGNITR